MLSRNKDVEGRQKCGKVIAKMFARVCFLDCLVLRVWMTAKAGAEGQTRCKMRGSWEKGEDWISRGQGDDVYAIANRTREGSQPINRTERKSESDGRCTMEQM